MTIRKFFAIFVAIAVLFAPSLTRAGVAFAAVPDHHLQMMESGHCKSAPSDAADPDGSSDKDDSWGKSCCVSMCMAVALGPSAPPAAAELHSTGATSQLDHQYHGRITEIATPPPRLA